MRIIYYSSLAAFLFCSFSLASQLTWLTLTGDYTYKDITKVCSNGGSIGPKLYFAAEIENDQPIHAALKEHPKTSSPTYSITLNEDELKEIVLYKDYYGKYWLKEIIFSERLMRWTLSHLGDIICQPPRDIKTVNPTVNRFYFDTEDLGLELMVSPSNRVEVKGVRENGMPYEAEILFDQKLY